MNGFISFISDSKVHDSMLMTMVITSFLAAIHRFKEVNNEPIFSGFWAFLKTLWNFFYDWLVGFWSMRQGQQPSKIQDPSQPVAPAQPK